MSRSLKIIFKIAIFAFFIITLAGMGILTKAVLDISTNVQCYNLSVEEKTVVDKVAADKIAAAKAAAEAAATAAAAKIAPPPAVPAVPPAVAKFSNIPDYVNTIKLSESELVVAKMAIVCFWIYLFIGIFGIKLIL